MSQTAVDSFAIKVLNNDYNTISFHDGPDTDNHVFFRSDKLTFVDFNDITTDLRDISEYELLVLENN